MLVAHLGTGHDARGGGWGEQWMWIFDGRSSALFATLAGVSLALMSRSTAREDRPGWRRLRVKIAVRAAILLVLGVVLQLFGTPVVVILTAYAVMFLMSLPVLRLGSRWLLLLAAWPWCSDRSSSWGCGRPSPGACSRASCSRSRVRSSASS